METKIKYDLFTFQLSPLKRIQMDMFENIPIESLINQKNDRFTEIFKDETLAFYHRKNKLNFKIEFQSDDFVLIRLANKKRISIEKDFQKHTQDVEPSCLVGIYNDCKVQTIAIESDLTSFGNSEVVARILERTFNRYLNYKQIEIKIEPRYFAQEFWDLINNNKNKIDKIKFELNYPNLPRVNDSVDEALKKLSKSTGSATTSLELDSGSNDTLREINESNKEISNLVEASSEGAGPIKVKLKGLRAWEQIGKNKKGFELEELEIEGSSELVNNYVKDLKNGILNE